MAGWPDGQMARGAAAAIAIGIASPAAATQTSGHPAIRPSGHPGEALTISLVTIGVGVRVWERFGHNAILVEDRERATRTAYNYGLFDFRQENFVLRFIQGRMWYWMQGLDADAMLQSYIRDNRSVWIQELDLSPDQRVALRDFLAWNERPEHRYYRYDYYRDNCSTRVRDALDRVLGGRFRALTDTVATGTTYRFHTKRLTADDLPLFTGLQVALGEPVDRPISAWEAMFLPLAVQEWARRMTVRDSAGRVRPLVRAERTLFTSSVPDPPARPPSRMLLFLAVGSIVGGLLAVGGRRASLLGWLGTGWTVLAGAAGVILTFLWAFTDHVVAYRNENLFQVSVLFVPLAALLLALVLGRSWARRPAVVTASLVALSSVAGLVLQVLPGFDQQNGEVLALAVPINLGLAWGVRRFGTGAAPAQS
jgi:hypothetical protein